MLKSSKLKSQPKTAGVFVRLSPELKAAIDEICEREDRQFSKIVRSLLTEYVNKNRKSRPRE